MKRPGSQDGRSEKISIPIIKSHDIPAMDRDRGTSYMKRSSDRSPGAVLLVLSSQPVRTSPWGSKSGTYGLMSSNGVPSRISTPSMLRTLPSIFSSRTIDIPMGLGRLGARVAKTPRSVVSIYGRTLNLNPRLRWNRYSRIICEKPSRSFKPSAKSSSNSIVPLTPAAPTGCIGIPSKLVKGL